MRFPFRVVKGHCLARTVKSWDPTEVCTSASVTLIDLVVTVNDWPFKQLLYYLQMG